MHNYAYSDINNNITKILTLSEDEVELQLNETDIAYAICTIPISEMNLYNLVDGVFVKKANSENIVLGKVKKNKCEEITSMADAIHISPISYDNKLLDADATAQQNISGKITELKNDIDLNITSTNLFWKDADNVIHTWNTPSEYLTWLQGLFNAITTRRTNLYALSWQGKAAIDAMTSINSINEYDINTLFNV